MQIYFARKEVKPTIRKVVGEGSYEGWWKVSAAPAEIYTREWHRAVTVLCELYLYGINR
jgi:hypothetical protein